MEQERFELLVSKLNEMGELMTFLSENFPELRMLDEDFPEVFDENQIESIMAAMKSVDDIITENT